MDSWIQLWQSLKRYERDGELLAEVTLFNGSWMGYLRGGRYTGPNADPKVIMSAVEEFFRLPLQS